jgi:hypothetical protein
MERKGDWTETYTGIHFWAIDPRPEEVDINDIAHALSQICRFNGHCSKFYSVAQHSVLAAEEAYKMGYDIMVQLATLMHDASEAYLCDIPRPIKPSLSNYKQIEENLMKCIFERFNIDVSYEDSRIKEIDNNLVCSEATYLLPSKGKEWNITQTKHVCISKFWEPELAKTFFLSKSIELLERIK